LERVKKKRRIRYTSKEKAIFGAVGVFLICAIILMVGYIRYRNLFHM